jgi:hypothetical protein
LLSSGPDGSIAASPKPLHHPVFMVKGKSFFTRGKPPDDQLPAPALGLNNPVTSDSPSRALLCLIEGDETVFEVEADANEIIDHLKASIHRRGDKGRFARVNSMDLTLLKVTESWSAV